MENPNGLKVSVKDNIMSKIGCSGPLIQRCTWMNRIVGIRPSDLFASFKKSHVNNDLVVLACLTLFLLVSISQSRDHSFISCVW